MQTLIMATMFLATTALPEIQIYKTGSGDPMAESSHNLVKRNGTVTSDVAEILGAAYGGGYFTSSKSCIMFRGIR